MLPMKQQYWTARRVAICRLSVRYRAAQWLSRNSSEGFLRRSRFRIRSAVEGLPKYTQKNTKAVCFCDSQEDMNVCSRDTGVSSNDAGQVCLVTVE